MLCPKCGNELAVTETTDKARKREGNTYISDIRVFSSCVACNYFKLSFKKLTQEININQ